MTTPIHPLELALTDASDGATNFDVISDQVPSGWTWLVDHYSVEDETSALTAIRVFKEIGAYQAGIEEVVGPVAGVLYDGDKPTVLTEGQRFGARFAGSTNGDVLRLHAFGLRLPPGAELTVELLAAPGRCR